MSLRPPVDKGRIEQFLRRLDATAHQTGRVYLVGGSALVHSGLRGRTLDIDLTVEADDVNGLLVAIRQVTHELQVNVKMASPGDFVPLPSGWHDRAQWVGRFGQLDVFYFDFYSIALSKIARGSQRDIDDVVLLAQSGVIDRAQLDAAYAEIEPQLGMGRYFNYEPDIVAANYGLVRQRLQP